MIVFFIKFENGDVYQRTLGGFIARQIRLSEMQERPHVAKFNHLAWSKLPEAKIESNVLQ